LFGGNLHVITPEARFFGHFIHLTTFRAVKAGFGRVLTRGSAFPQVITFKLAAFSHIKNRNSNTNS
jgi:hypothetical protein